MKKSENRTEIMKEVASYCKEFDATELLIILALCKKLKGLSND